MELEEEINMNENEVDEILKKKEFIEALNHIRKMRPSSFEKSRTMIKNKENQKKNDNGNFDEMFNDYNNNNIEKKGSQKKGKKEKKKKKSKNDEDEEDKPKRKNKKKKVE